MSRLTPGRAAWLLWLALSVASCTDDAEEEPVGPEDAATPSDGQVGAPDAGLDAGPPPVPGPATDAAVVRPLLACLDRPDSLVQALTRELPCELLPPGFAR
jgi:hypothetical protein